MSKAKEVIWLDDVEEHDYPAAESYLKLLFKEHRVAGMIAELKTAPIQHFAAKDIFRASQLSLLGVSNLHVDKDRKKIKKNIPLSPLLIVRDEINGKVVIADGYHRLCALYEFDEDAQIRCKLI
jgi:hypothetical protein